MIVIQKCGFTEQLVCESIVLVTDSWLRATYESDGQRYTDLIIVPLTPLTCLFLQSCPHELPPNMNWKLISRLIFAVIIVLTTNMRLTTSQVIVLLTPSGIL